MHKINKKQDIAMQFNQMTPRINFIELLQYNRPQATAWVNGNTANPQLSGLIKFYQTSYGGVLVEAEIFGLPEKKDSKTGSFFGMHIHQSGNCSDNFSNVGTHYNPGKEAHPFHAGDLLPLLDNQGYAWSAFYTKRFTVTEIIGRSVIIHANPDDFTTQPSGNSGAMIGCGEIRRIL